MLLIILAMIFLPIVVGIFIYMLHRVWFNRILFVYQIAQTIMLFALISTYQKFGVISFNLGGWKDGIAIELRISAINLLFIGMTTLALWYVYMYTWEAKKEDHKFLFFVSFLQGSLIGLFTAYDLFTIYILLELVTILSSMLIIYKKDGESIKAGFFYLMFNSLAMCIYFLGVVVLYIEFGTLNIGMIKDLTLLCQADVHFRLGIGMMIIAFSVKSAVFPLFIWLPMAHGSAPTEISAVLSGLIVKSGLYGFIIVLSLIDSAIVRDLLFVLGIITSVVGFVYAILQKDIKRILAFSTLSQVGLIMIGLSSFADKGYLGGILHIFNHFLFKSLLFICAGTIIGSTSHRDITEIHGILRRNKVLAIGLITGLLSITGMPFLNGYLSKYLLKSSIHTIDFEWLYNFINVGTMVYAIKFSTILFSKGKNYEEYIDASKECLIHGAGDVFVEKKIKLSIGKSLSILYLTILLIASYPIEYYILSGVYGVNLPKLESIINGSISYLITLGMGIGAYRIIVRKIKGDHGYIKRGFQEAAALFIFYSSMIMLFMKYVV